MEGGEPNERKPEHDCRHYRRSPGGLTPTSDLGWWNRKLAVLAPVRAPCACPRCVHLFRDYQSAPAALTVANAPGDEPRGVLLPKAAMFRHSSHHGRLRRNKLTTTAMPATTMRRMTAMIMYSAGCRDMAISPIITMHERSAHAFSDYSLITQRDFITPAD